MRPDEGSQGRLNVALCALVLLCVAGVAFSGVQMWRQHAAAGGDTGGGVAERAWSVLTDRRGDRAASRAGERVGARSVTAVPKASVEEQQRIAAVLQATSTMVSAFLNVHYDDIDASIDAVLALSTGRFRATYARSAENLRAETLRNRYVSTSEVLWTAYVDGDDRSATVLAAADGTLQNTSVDKPQARAHRMMLTLVLRDGQWLTRRLEYIS